MDPFYSLKYYWVDALYIDGLVQNCSANVLELLQFCTKPSI